MFLIGLLLILHVVAYSVVSNICSLFSVLITFRVSRSGREMCCGHPRLCVCLCVCTVGRVAQRYNVGLWSANFPCPALDLWLMGDHLCKPFPVGQPTRST